MGKEARRWPSVLNQHDAYSERAAVAEEAQAANSAKEWPVNSTVAL